MTEKVFDMNKTATCVTTTSSSANAFENVHGLYNCNHCEDCCLALRYKRIPALNFVILIIKLELYQPCSLPAASKSDVLPYTKSLVCSLPTSVAISGNEIHGQHCYGKCCNVNSTRQVPTSLTFKCLFEEEQALH